MPEVRARHALSSRPQLAAATEEEAIALVNRWPHREVGMALNVAYGATGALGIVGDVYVHAATGAFIGAPDATD